MPAARESFLLRLFDEVQVCLHFGGGSSAKVAQFTMKAGPAARLSVFKLITAFMLCELCILCSICLLAILACGMSHGTRQGPVTNSFFPLAFKGSMSDVHSNLTLTLELCQWLCLAYLADSACICSCED